jgi:hypothetical protein
MMIAGTQNTDRKILAISLPVEEVVWKRLNLMVGSNSGNS